MNSTDKLSKYIYILDYRCGRNLGRTFLQYYRFINVLPVPILPEVQQKRKNRPRTHHSRSRSKSRYEVKPRPKTTRSHAPISYMNLSISYESGNEGYGGAGGGYSSDEGGFSPYRCVAPGSSHFSGSRNYRRSMGSSTTHTHDQFSLLNLSGKSIKQDGFHYHNESEKRHKTASSAKTVAFDLPVNVPPKPYLSIIDLNQLTRGSLKHTVGSFDDDRR